MPLRYWNAIVGKQSFRLILVEIHLCAFPIEGFPATQYLTSQVVEDGVFCRKACVFASVLTKTEEFFVPISINSCGFDYNRRAFGLRTGHFETLNL